jgi:hypothetical protein
MLERVLRLLKLTSFSMVAWMRSGETCWRAAAIAGSFGAGAIGDWAWRLQVRSAARGRQTRRRELLVKIIVLLWKPNRRNNRRLDVAAARPIKK